MIASIRYSKKFRENLSGYKSKFESPKEVRIVEKSPDHSLPDKSLKKESQKDLYLDYGADTIETAKGLTSINYKKPLRVLVERPDLSKEIQEAKNRISNEKEKQENVLIKEKEVIDKVKILQQDFDQVLKRQDLRQKNTATCEKERLDLVKCLKKEIDCNEILIKWRFCQETSSY